jgi:putative transposase
VLDHLPERERPQVKQRLRRAWAHDDHDRALDQLRQLGRELDHSYPGAAGSLREGMEETLTLTRLGVSGNLKRTLESTNPIESMIEIVRWTQRVDNSTTNTGVLIATYEPARGEETK